MNCPHCGCERNRITDTDTKQDRIVRHRLCRGCAGSFSTTETLNTQPAQARDFLEPAPVNPSSRYRPADPGDIPAGLGEDTREMLLLWWNESRWSKHRGHAVWTRFAFRKSAERLASCPSEVQYSLAEAAAENGWMAIKADYLPAIDGHAGAASIAGGGAADREEMEAMEAAVAWD